MSLLSNPFSLFREYVDQLITFKKKKLVYFLKYYQIANDHNTNIKQTNYKKKNC